MGLDAAGKQCKIEVFADDDGVRLICNTVVSDACPLSHPGDLTLDCLRGVPAAPDSHMIVTPGAMSTGDAVPHSSNAFEGFKAADGEMIQMPEEGEKKEPDFEQDYEEASIFEEAPAPAPKKPEPPRKDIVKMPQDDDGNDDEEVADQWFEQVVEEYETVNDYTFGLVAVRDSEREVVVTMTIDNVSIDILLEDFIEMAKSIRDALPRFKEIYMEE